MSDDLVNEHAHRSIQHEGETYISLLDASITFAIYRTNINHQAAEIERLRAWREAINGRLTSWMHPVLDGEEPHDALMRLLDFEQRAFCDPAVSQDAADLVVTARREGMEEAAKLAADFETVAYQHGNLPYMDPHESAAQAAREIAAHILRAAEKEGK